MIKLTKHYFIHYLLPSTHSLLFYCLLSTAYCLLSYAYPPGWSDDILLTPEDMKIRSDPDVGVDSFNNVWVTWDSATWVNGTGEVLYSKRDSLGGALIPETDVSNNATYSITPSVAVDASNNIQFVWLDETPQGLGLWHAKIANDGSVIIPPHLAVSGNNNLFPLEGMVINKYKEINVIWDELVGYNQMNYTKLDSMGNSIIPKMRVSPESVLAFWPGIGVDSFANNHLGYRTNRTSTDSLAYTKLDKDGNFLIDYKILDVGLLPTIIADKSQNIHMAYLHLQTPYGPLVINYLKLDQNGNILIGPKTLSIHEDNNWPHMTMDSLQYLHVVWGFNNMFDTIGIMYTKLDTLGNFVIPPMKVVYPPYTPGCGIPRIAVDRDNHLHLVWVDTRIDTNTTDIFYKRGENEQTVEELQRIKLANLPRISVSPNPFINETKITYSFGITGSKTKTIESSIYDILGRKVKGFSLLSTNQRDGTQRLYEFVWDGHDDFRCSVPAGVYFIRVQDGSSIRSTSVILSR